MNDSAHDSTSSSVTSCPLCQMMVDRAHEQRCQSCGADTTHEAFDALGEADAALAQLRVNYAEIAERWNQWAARRDALLAVLNGTRTTATSAPSAAPAATPEPAAEPAAAVAAAGVPTATTWAAVTSPTISEREDASPGASASRADSVENRVPTPSPTPAPKPSKKPSKLTPPTLLGIAGAALLIAAAIVYVAVTWESFPPVAQGFVVLAVGGAVAYVATWLTKLDLPISGGAVGIVAMAFAGVSVVAFDRDAGSLGTYTATVAVLVAGMAGFALGRLNVMWVNIGSAIAVVLSSLSFTIAFGTSDGGQPAALWTLAGATSASLVLLTHRTWRTPEARAIIKFGGVAWLTLTALPAAVSALTPGAEGADLVACLAPTAVMWTLARWWPKLTVGPATTLVTVSVASAATLLDNDLWHATAAVAAVLVVAGALGQRTPAVWHRPLLWGLAPGLAVVVGMVSFALVQALVGTPLSFTVSIARAATAAILVAAFASVRGWDARAQFHIVTERAGAIVALVVAILVVEPVSRALGGTLSTSALAISAGAIVSASSILAWKTISARLIAGVGSTVLATLGGLTGVMLLTQDSQVAWHTWAAVAVATLSLGAAAARWPRITWGSTTLLLALAGGATMAHVPVQDRISYATVVAAVFVMGAALAWVSSRMRAAFHQPAVWGLLCATIVGAGVTLIPLGISIVLVVIIAIATLSAVHKTDPLIAHLERFGATYALVAGGLLVEPIAYAWGGGSSAVALALSGGALISAASVAIWNDLAARRIAGIGATVLATVGGTIGSVVLMSEANSTWHTYAAVAVATVGLIAASVRWPHITWGPAALLTTLAAASLTYHGALQGRWADSAAISAAVLAAALVAFVTTMLSKRYHQPALWGILLATTLGAGAALFSFAEAVAVVFVNDGFTSRTGVWQVVTLAAFTALVVVKRPLIIHHATREAANIAAATSGAVTVAMAAAFTVTELGFSQPWTGTAVAAVSTALYVLLAWGVPRLKSAAAHTTLKFLAIAWVTALGLQSLLHLGDEGFAWWGPLAALVICLGALALAEHRWPRAALASIALLVSLAPAAIADAALHSTVATLAFAAAGTALAAWLIKLIPHTSRTAVVIGVSFAAMLGTGGTVLAGSEAIQYYAAQLAASSDLNHGAISLWGSFTAIAAATAVFALREARERMGWIALPFVLIAAAGLALPWFWVALLGYTLATVRARARLNATPALTLVSAVAALLAANAEDAARMTAALIAVGLLLWLARTLEPHLRDAMLVAAPVFAAVAGASLALSLGGSQGWAATLALASALAASIGTALTGLDVKNRIAPGTTLAATILIPITAGSLTGAGIAYLLAAVAWFALMPLKVAHARTLAIATSTLGTALILLGANIETLEAYFAVPGVSFLIIGARSMLRDATVTSMRGLGPGLGVLLIPSYLALAADLESVPRTLFLTLAVLIMALWGVSLQWLAPILAATITAVIVAVAQIAAESSPVPVWAAVGIVGVLILTISARYERLQRMR